MAAEIRLVILKAFQANGLLLEKEALSAFTEYVTSVDDAHKTVAELIETCHGDDKLKISHRDAKEVISRHHGGGPVTEFIQIISAFDIPRIKFDPIRKAFYQSEGPGSLFGEAAVKPFCYKLWRILESLEDKRGVYLERLYILQQRLARNPLFSRPVFGDLSKRDFVELTEIKALLGSIGQTKTVMGFISQLEDGQFYIEDLSGALKIDLSEAMTAAGFYVENCVVAAEGHLQHDGSFKVCALGMPPNERREESIASAKGLDFFGGTELTGEALLTALDWEAAHPEDRLIILSDVWLDRAPQMAHLEAILDGFESLEQLPSTFVLLGNFHSYSCNTASTDYTALKANFESLALMLSQHKRIMGHSKLVFVPGSNDPGPAAVFPRPPLPAVLTGKLRETLPNATFASNPCRIRHYSQEIVLFRDDLQRRMRYLCLRPPVEGEGGASSDLGAAECMFEHLAMTVTQQSHICPVPLDNQAVYWQMDHALRLYPLPHALVLADSAPAADFVEKKSGCVCINPGSLSNGTFAAYKPSSQEAELCDVPELME